VTYASQSVVSYSDDSELHESWYASNTGGSLHYPCARSR